MTQEVLKMALEALENNKQTHYYCDNTWYSCPKHEDGCANEFESDECNCGADKINAEFDKAITAIKEALAKEKALQALHSENERLGLYKDAYAQPEQEPVGDEWTPCMKLPVVVYVRKQRFGESHVSTREGITPVKPDDLIMRGVSGEEYPIGRAIFERTYSLNTTPPQRTWVGLTDEELMDMYNEPRSDAEMIAFGREVEAKLKEKNCAG
jgi:hypothetical protein